MTCCARDRDSTNAWMEAGRMGEIQAQGSSNGIGAGKEGHVGLSACARALHPSMQGKVTSSVCCGQGAPSILLSQPKEGTH